MFKLGLKKAEEPEINSPLPAGCPRVQLNSNATYLEIASDSMGFPGGSEGKETACNAGDLGLTPGLGRSSGEGKGSPLQYSGLEHSRNRIVRGVAESQTRPSDFRFHRGRGSVLFLRGQTPMLDAALPSPHSELVPKRIAACLIHLVASHTALLLIREERVARGPCLWNSPRSPPS